MYYIEQVAAHTKLTEGQIEQWVEARNRAEAEEMDRSKFWYIQGAFFLLFRPEND